MTLGKKRTLRILITPLVFGLACCAPKGYESSAPSQQEPAASFQQDPRLQKEIQKEAPRLAKNPSAFEFQQSLKGFRLLRYDFGFSKPRLLGNDGYTLEVVTQPSGQQSKILVFSGKLQTTPDGELIFNDPAQNDSRYVIIGSITAVADELQGRFRLQYKGQSAVQTATILYRGHQAHEETSVWENHFAVPFGVETEEVSTIKEEDQKSLESLLEFGKPPQAPTRRSQAEEPPVAEKQREVSEPLPAPRPVPPSPPPAQEKAVVREPSRPPLINISWGGRNESAEWTAIIKEAVSSIGKNMLRGAKDMPSFCPNYDNLDREARLNFWAFFFSQMAYYESSYQTTSRLVEAGLSRDAVTGKQNTSEGLLQVSYQDSRYHKGGCDFDWDRDKALGEKDQRKTIFDPSLNLRCGVQIMENQIRKYGLIVVNSKRGYWAILIKGHRYNKISEIKNKTNKFPLCRSKTLMVKAETAQTTAVL